jgi:hypothetical protein
LRCHGNEALICRSEGELFGAVHLYPIDDESGNARREPKGAEMHIVRIEHAIHDFGSWKAAFERDPAGRQESGVRRYRILRAPLTTRTT